MTGLLVLATSIAVAFFLGRGLEPWRPTDLAPLGIALGVGVLSPLAVTWIVGEARDLGGPVATFLAFAAGVLLIGYMVLAGTWALRFLAEQAARFRA